MTIMIGLALAAITYVRAYIVSRHRLGLEIAALRQQLVVYKRNDRALYGATSIDCFGLGCANGGPVGRAP